MTTNKFGNLWCKTLLLFLFQLIIATACAGADRESKSECISAKGKWTFGSHLLGRVKFSSGEEINYDVQISCQGRYEIFVGFIPKENVSIVSDKDCLNAYVETLTLKDSTINQRFLESHDIRYAINVYSLADPQRRINVVNSLTKPNYPGGGISSVGLQIPRNFRINERFRISITINADESFFEDYRWLGATIRVPIH